MQAAEREKIPYGPVDHVLGLIRRFRERGLPNVLDLEALTQAGVPLGNAPRTLVALKFLGLVDEIDERTEAFDRLGQAPTEKYAEQLAEIIRAKYASVFTVIDPASATDMEFADAFRQFEPRGQRDRMIALFRALCKEAGIISGGSPARRRSQPTPRTVEQESPGDHSLMTFLLRELPESRSWTSEERERWVRAFESNLDIIIKIRE